MRKRVGEMKRKIVSQQLHNCAIPKGDCQIERNLFELAAHFSVYIKKLSFKIKSFVSGPPMHFLIKKTKAKFLYLWKSPKCPSLQPLIPSIGTTVQHSTRSALASPERGGLYCAMARISHFGRKRKGENCIAQKSGEEKILLLSRPPKRREDSLGALG